MTAFVLMYHPKLGNARASVSLSSVDDHARKGWLLVDQVTPPPFSPTLRAVEDAAVVNPTGQWDFDLAPTVAGVPMGTGGLTAEQLAESPELRAASVAAVQAAIEVGEIVVGGGLSVRDDDDGTVTLVAA